MKVFETLVRKGEEMGLREHISKTKIMRFGKQRPRGGVRIGQYKIEEVEKFTQLEITITDTGDRGLEIREKKFNQQQQL